MADPKRMDVGQTPEQLVHVQLHAKKNKKNRHTYELSFITEWKQLLENPFQPSQVPSVYQQMFRKWRHTL